MKLVERVEVAYFRSIYKESLNGCNDTNIIFGRNDSGKSNILRALNLFFNNNTSPDLDFNFLQDFNHSRRAEAGGEGDIRKFVYVKIWFNTPTTWRPSLGDQFWVKKQWSISFDSDAQITTNVLENKRHYLTRFLNKIRLYYIPAIKDRKIFESLQANIYKVIALNAEFSGSLINFTNALRERTQDLSLQLLNDLKVASVVTTPKDLTDLFRSLDFETTSEAGDSYSLTLQRGDGVQVRHIAPILSFLANHSSEDFHIWAFEEPENSLELANAIDEAERFRSYGQQSNKQVFLTSHSPAFFSLDHEDISRYFVSRSQKIQDRINSSIVKIGASPELLPSELMGETPHLPVISAYLRDAHNKITQQNEDQRALLEILDAHNQSIVFVEGASDALIFTKAWQILIGGVMPLRFEAAGGTSKMEALTRDGKILTGVAPGRNIFALVDNDSAGRALYSHGRLNKGKWVQHNSNKVYWCRLPYNQEFEHFMLEIALPKDCWPGSLENFFSPALRRRAQDAGALQLTEFPHSEIVTSENLRKFQAYLTPREDLKHFHILTTHEDFKISFAEWIINMADAEPDIFEPLRPIFVQIVELLTPN
ncbi:AAA domain-containing protein, putative AbiEii toxin, Type IV TA system [Pseudomonas helmanticensis]|uniref:AAA domain-containing protein, putative AbiEii toxin, Type IV TA system n=1 Tax=Pseudomonas helmanticensis TaxID=1471381 RepID=A0ACD2U7P5_9PSED|nr:AAA family ATPase [Pseudomonas helmanticensis]SMQ26931.1 AAA domain-containing protein, putative AbiEii toxin, Type IV TA system [Pseudomonas helmanticensis]